MTMVTSIEKPTTKKKIQSEFVAKEKNMEFFGKKRLYDVVKNVYATRLLNNIPDSTIIEYTAT